MAALNYYLGLKHADDDNIGNVVTSNTTNAGPGGGTAADVELRLQINDGSNATNITKEDVITRMRFLEEFILSGGPDASGTNLPAM